MPLANLTPEKQCQAISHRTGERCKNFKAWGCPTRCRYHGARRPETILRGANHPQFRHGNETKEAKNQRQKSSRRLHELVDLGNAIGMFQARTKLRGRKPKTGILGQ